MKGEHIIVKSGPECREHGGGLQQGHHLLPPVIKAQLHYTCMCDQLQQDGQSICDALFLFQHVIFIPYSIVTRLLFLNSASINKNLSMQVKEMRFKLGFRQQMLNSVLPTQEYGSGRIRIRERLPFRPGIVIRLKS